MKIGWLLIVSLGLYLTTISQSLWLDEAISANVVKNFGYSQILQEFSPGDFHPPGYYLALKTWGIIGGYSVISLRLFSVVCTLMTVFIVYKLSNSGVAMMVAFNPLLVYYAIEMRMYALVMAIMISAIYLLINKKYLLLGILCGLGFLTFYGSIFLIMAMGLYLVVNRKFKELIIFSIGPLIALLIVWPLLTVQLKKSKEILPLVTNWELVLGKVNLKNILLIPIKFTSGRISWYPKASYYLLAGVWAIYVFWKIIRSKSEYRFFFWTSLILGIGFSFLTPMLQYFRFLYLVPIMGLIIGKNKVVIVGFFIFTLTYLINSSFHREDWQSLAKNLEGQVYMIPSFGDPIHFYNENIVINDIHQTISENRIAVVPYGEAIHGIEHVKLLEKQGYKLESKVGYRELDKEIWIKN